MFEAITDDQITLDRNPFESRPRVSENDRAETEID